MVEFEEDRDISCWYSNFITYLYYPTKKVSCLRPFKLLKAKYLCELYTRVITHVNKLRDLRHLFTHVNTRIYAG